MYEFRVYPLKEDLDYYMTVHADYFYIERDYVLFRNGVVDNAVFNLNDIFGVGRYPPLVIDEEDVNE